MNRDKFSSLFREPDDVGEFDRSAGFPFKHAEISKDIDAHFIQIERVTGVLPGEDMKQASCGAVQMGFDGYVICLIGSVGVVRLFDYNTYLEKDALGVVDTTIFTMADSNPFIVTDSQGFSHLPFGCGAYSESLEDWDTGVVAISRADGSVHFLADDGGRDIRCGDSFSDFYGRCLLESLGY